MGRRIGIETARTSMDSIVSFSGNRIGFLRLIARYDSRSFCHRPYSLQPARSKGAFSVASKGPMRVEPWTDGGRVVGARFRSRYTAPYF
jgi:hypothetical protein